MFKCLAQFLIYRRLSRSVVSFRTPAGNSDSLNSVTEEISVKKQSQDMCARLRKAEASRV